MSYQTSSIDLRLQFDLRSDVFPDWVPDIEKALVDKGYPPLSNDRWTYEVRDGVSWYHYDEENYMEDEVPYEVEDGEAEFDLSKVEEKASEIEDIIRGVHNDDETPGNLRDAMTDPTVSYPDEDKLYEDWSWNHGDEYKHHDPDEEIGRWFDSERM